MDKINLVQIHTILLRNRFRLSFEINNPRASNFDKILFRQFASNLIRKQKGKKIINLAAQT